MSLSCPTCDGRIRSADIDTATATVTCTGCAAEFSLALDHDGAAAVTTADHRRERLRVPLPKGIRVDDCGPNLRVVRSWYSPLVFILLIFCAAWLSFLVVWYRLALTGSQAATSGAGGSMGTLMLLFPIGHVAVGLGLAYFVACCFLNQTTIEVVAGTLTVRHGPLPWPGAADLPTASLDQLYCRQRIHRSRNGTRTTYELHAALRDGRRRKLLSGLQDSDQAHYVEQQIEDKLRLTDRAVPGEFT